MEWKETKLGDLIYVKHGYAFKGTHITKNENDKVLVTPGHFAIGGGWKPINKKFYDGEILEDYVLTAGDVVVTMTDLSKKVDTLGYSALVPTDNEKIYLHNQRIGLVEFLRNEEEYSPEFLYWLMQSPEYRWHIVSSATGSTVHHTSPNRIYSYLFECPPIGEQREIARTLSLLDSKIDLLRQQNETLEAMGAAVFREWFNDEGTVATVEDVADHIKVSVKPQNNPSENYHHFSLPAFDNGKRPTQDTGGDIRSNKYAIPENAILVSKLNPRFPRVWLVTTPPSNPICSTEFQIFQPTDLNYLSFLYFFFQSPFATGTLTMAASGTSGSHQRVRPSDIQELEFTYESYDQIVAFDEIATPILNKIEQNISSIQSLEATRDLLLPKLMSGEVKVRSDG